MPVWTMIASVSHTRAIKSLLRAIISQTKVGKGVNVRNIAKIVSFNSNTHSKSERESLPPSLRLILSSVDLIICTRLTSAHTSISQLTMTKDVTIQSFQDDSYFCSGPNTSSSNSCSRSARESAAPFPVQAGRVIFLDRTSGSPEPNDSDTSTVTVPVAAGSCTAATSLTDPHNKPQ